MVSGFELKVKLRLIQRSLFTTLFLILNYIYLVLYLVIDFLGFPPSAIAAAAVLCTAGISVDNTADDDGLPSSFYEKVDKVNNNSQFIYGFSNLSLLSIDN